VETRDGIEVVTSPGEPLLDDAGTLVSRLWVVQGSDWVDPSRVHTGSGFVTVADPQANQVHVVTVAGEIRPSIGRPGGGPGEFLGLLDAFRDGDRLVALDAGKGSVEYLDPDGGYLSSLHLDGQPWGGFPLEDGTLLVKGEFLSDPTAETTGDWVRVGKGIDPIAFTHRTLEPLPEEQGVECSDLSPWAAGAARMRFTTPRIEVFDPTGALLREIAIDLPVEEVTHAEREAALSDLRRTMADRGYPPEMAEQSVVVMTERWRVKCRFGPLRFDTTRRYAAFMEQNPDEFGSGAASLHFLSEDGVYLARVTFPTAWRDFTLTDGVVYALARDPATDLISLAAFRVDLPGSLLSDAGDVLQEARRHEGSTGDER
jgi:hypothetical protein